jgi:hypothetical protein
MAIGSGKRFQYFTEQISGAGVGRTSATWRFRHRPVSPRPNPANKIALPLLEIARVLVRFDKPGQIVSFGRPAVELNRSRSFESRNADVYLATRIAT